MAGTWTRRRFLAGAGAVIAGSYLVDPRLALAAAAAPPDEDGYELWLRYRLVADPFPARGISEHVQPGGPPG